MTGADIDETHLRERARRLLAAGRLPVSEPVASWAGAGRSQRCYVCHVLVRPDQIAFDLSFRTPESEVELHMHSHCRIAWEWAREAAERGDEAL